MEKLNILICEDKAENIQAAREQLAGHNISTASTLIEAMMVLGNKTLEDIPSYGGSFLEANLPIPQYKGGIDVVLTDMYMPGGHVKGLYSFDGQLAPVGVMIALRAASLGVKWVGLMSDSNHHNDAMTCGIDMLNGTWFSTERPLTINHSKVVFTTAKMVGVSGGGYVKDWRMLLDGLIA